MIHSHVAVVRLESALHLIAEYERGLMATSAVLCARRAPPPDGGLKLIKVEYEKMWTHEDNSAMLLVTDQLLTAVHNFPNLAVLCSPESSLDEEPAHNLYHPVVRTSRLLDDMAQAGMTVYVDISDVSHPLC